MRLSDTIEHFIKELMTQEEPAVELRRNELAEYFSCAPSQINYVLATRFTPDNGYIIESRRGGGGYIRIVRIVRSSGQRLQWMIRERIGTALTGVEALRLIGQLTKEGIITRDEADIMRAAVSDQALGVPMPENVKDALRARTMKAMLTAVAGKNRQNDAGPSPSTPL